jgi:tetratricopeptide (TPR) repeat protein
MTEAAFAAQREETERAVGPDVGQRIRKARVERGMTLAQLGGGDLSRSFLSLVETGKARISLRSLSIVARRLELPLSYFVSDTSREEAAELLLNDALAAMRRDRPEECLRIVDQVELTDDTRTQALFLRGWAYLELSRTKEAIETLREVAPLVDTAGDARQIAEVHARLSIALFRVSSYHEAFQQIILALQAAAEVGDPVLTGKLTSMLGHIYYVQNDIDASIAQYTLARQHFGSISDLDGLASVYSGLSYALRQRGDVKSALRYSRLAVGICEARAWERGAAEELNNLATWVAEAGDLDAGLKAARESIVRAQRCSARDIEAVAHSTLAALLLRTNDLDEARAEAEAASALADSDTSLPRIFAWIALAQLAELDGDHDTADDLFLRSLAGFKSIGAEAKYANAALSYGRVLRARGDLEGTIRYLDIAAAHSVKGLPGVM